MSDSLTLDTIKIKAEALSEEIRAADPSLQLIYAAHHHGHLQNTLHLMEDLILEHPAGTIARSIVNRVHPALEPSAFLGLAAYQHKSWFSLYTTTSMLALISMNVNQYNGFDEALFDLYHHTWQGMEMAELCRRPEMLERMQNRPMVPKRGPMNEAKANLRADVFSALMMSTDGHENAARTLGALRGAQVLRRSPHHKPENYPFVMGAEATEYALAEIYDTLDARRPRLLRCQDITTEISNATTDDQIRQWWRFCEPAQDMAWRGYDEAEILAAALYTCEDPYVRAIAHQVISLTGIKPNMQKKETAFFNPFVNLQRNSANHYALIQETFEIGLAQGLDHDSSKPLLTAANVQNRDLLQGRFLGWCATALQAAANAFDLALNQGKSPEQAAKLEFEIHRHAAPLEGLEHMSKDIVQRKRKGELVTMEQLPAIARDIPDMEHVIKSIKKTMADPNYQMILSRDHGLTPVVAPAAPGLVSELANDFAPQSPTAAPAGPAANAAPVVLEFSPGGAPALPPMTRPVSPFERHKPKPKAAKKAEDGSLSLELAFAEADSHQLETPPAK